MHTRKTRVVMVHGDDDLADVQKRLASRGYDVHCVTTAEQAAQEVERESSSVGLVVIDAVLGNAMVGSAAAARLLAGTRVPLVLLVSHTASETFGINPELVCHGCVTKDASAAVLDTALSMALRLFQRERGAGVRQEQFERAAARAKLGFWEYDAPASRFVASDSVREILGFAPHAPVDLQTVSGLHAPQSADMLERAVEFALKEGTPFNLVSEIQTTSGRRKWIRTQGQLDREPASGCRRVFGTVQDISELRLLDRMTQESEMTLNQVEQITHVGHWSVSLSDGSFFHSDETKRIFGYEPSGYALSVEEAINCYHPDDRAEVIRQFNRAVETGEDYQFDLRIVQPSGDIRHVHSKGYAERDERGTVSRVYGVLQDVTDRVMSERALRDSEASMKALIDGVRTAIVVHGKRGEVLLSNQMANRLLAPMGADMVGKELTDPAWCFVHEDGREVAVDELPVSTILRSQAPIENLVLGCRDRERITWLLMNGLPVVDENGQLSKVVISFVDISERREMAAQFQQSEKMRAIGQLAGGVAHDFNNQLTVMLYCAELLRESSRADSLERSWIEGIITSASRSAELTKQLLAFARKGKYVVKAVDINAIVSEVVSIANRSFDKKIRITSRANVAPATIAGDASQLQNALLNMALNARDAMPDGGELEFTTERVALEERELRSTGLDSEPGGQLRLTIRDTGVGMDAATRERIFEPFFTTKEQGTGTGMGMASVYGTVKSHHGAIEVESRPGVGTTLTLYFPLVVEQTPMHEEPLPIGRTSTGRILIIDDEENVAALLSTMLRRKGYETTTCANGRDGVREFAKSPGDTDLVLLDMIMPEMNGAETFYALRAIDAEAKVVLISGYSFTDEARRILADGAAGFLEKPVALKQLLQTVADVMRSKGDQAATR